MNRPLPTNRNPEFNLEDPLLFPPPGFASFEIPTPLDWISLIRTNPLGNFPRSAYQDPHMVWPLGRGQMHFIFDPALIEEVLLHQMDTFPKALLQNRFLKPILGDSLLTKEGMTWRRQRKIAAPIFRPRALDMFTPGIQEAIDDIVADWPVERPVNVVPLCQKLTLEVLQHSLFSEAGNIDSKTLLNSASRVLKSLGQLSFVDLFNLPFFMRPQRWPAMVHTARIRRMVTDLIDERSTLEDPGNDLLGRFIKARDVETGEHMQKETVIDNVMTLYAAGFETTAVSLAWALHVLARNQDLQDEVLKEANLAEGDSGDPFTRYPFTLRVVKETMRLFPSVPVVIRTTTRDVALGDLSIRKGGLVYICIFVSQRNELTWKDPHRFNPDRFRPEEEEKRHRSAFLAFGTGPRVCIGARFAQMEAVLAVAGLVRAFHFPKHRETTRYQDNIFPCEQKAASTLLQIAGDGLVTGRLNSSITGETGYCRDDLRRSTDGLIVFFKELRRRKIWWVAGVYLAASWIVVQVVATMEGTFSLPSWLDMVTVTLLVAGFPLALILTWAQETQADTKGDPLSPDAAGQSDVGTASPPQSDDLASLSIAVLPFDNFTGDESNASLADGISEDITAHLTFQSFFRVKARNSSFQFKGTSLDITAVGKQLNVNFVLEGSIRVVDDMLRITSQLIAVQTGIHIWSDRINEPLSEIGRTGDAVTQQIADIASDRMLHYLRKQYADKPEKELGALGLALRADAIQVIDQESRDRKRALMQRAVDKAPGIPEFRAILNNIIANDYSNLFSEDPAREREEVIRRSEVLLHGAPQNPVVLLLTAQSYSIIGKSEEAVRLARQADAIAPRRESRLVLANTTWRAGMIDEAIEHLEALQASARAGDNGPLEVMTGVQVCKGNLESALRSSDLETLHRGDVFLTWLLRANILAVLGRMEEARECIRRVRAMLPRFTLEGAIIGFKQNHSTQLSQDRMTEGLKLLLADEEVSRR